MIRALAVTLAATLTTTVGLAAPASASAVTAGTGCSYPQVCLYKSANFTHPTGRFRDVTAGWQHLTRSRGAQHFTNTRHDDVAYLRLTDGRVICVAPNTTGGLMSGGVTAIRISYRNHC